MSVNRIVQSRKDESVICPRRRKGIMRRLHCQIINVSNRAIEETAGIILDYVRKNKERHGDM